MIPMYVHTSACLLPDTVNPTLPVLQAGFSAVLSYDPSLCVLAYCLDSPSTRVKVLVLKVSWQTDPTTKREKSHLLFFVIVQLMVTVLLAPGGHKKVMQAFDYFRAVMKERTRFQMLVGALVQEPVDPAFQVENTPEPL